VLDTDYLCADCSKLDSSTKKPLAGAEFKITTDSGELVADKEGTISSNGIYVSDENGEIHISGLDPDGYTITETKAPDGYILSGTPITVEVAANDAQTIKVENAPTKALTIQKYESGTQNPLAGVTFLITTSDGNIVGANGSEYVTDQNGRIVLEGLVPGITVTARETGTISGYKLNSEPKSILIKAGETQELVFYNEPLCNLTIQKKDSKSGEPLSGAQFLVTDQTGAPVGASDGHYTTGANGMVTISGLTPGASITAREEKAPAGYTLNTEPQTIVVKSGQDNTLTFVNEAKGSLILLKLDSRTSKPLSGAEFKITTSGGQPVGNLEGAVTSNGMYISDENGEIRLTGLAPDTYIITEAKAPDGYLLNPAPTTVEVNTNDTQTVRIYNTPTQTLTIQKYVYGTNDPIRGVTFLVTDSSGKVLGPNNGEYTTDRSGRIVLTGLTPGATITAKEVRTASGYILDATPQSILIKEGEAQTMTFYNKAKGGLELIKVSESDTSKRIPGAVFEIRKVDGGLVTSVTTDSTGRIHVDLDAGDYYVVETEAAEGFKLDATPRYFTVEDGKTATLTITNKAFSGILLHKTDSVTGEGIYGVTFLLYDSTNTPIGQYTSDNSGYVYIENLTASGYYYLRELENEGYVPDTQMKTVYVATGETTLVEWKNTPVTAQIQIVKRSADYNPTNGLPAGTLLEGAVFEIYDKAGNLADTIKSDSRGLASSKPLSLGRYTVREVKAPDNYGVNDAVLNAYLEHEGQILTFEVTDQSLTTGAAITKTGPKEVMGGQPVRYVFSGIANTSNVRLDSFYWRDTLPAQVRLDCVVTGTYNFPGSYKITYRVNGGEPLTLADNLSTGKNYTLAASPAALGLASDERVTEIMFVFGQAPGGFAQVEKPTLYCTALSNLQGGSSFVNVADVGGVYNGHWIQAISRWVTAVYGKPTTLPRTGY